MDKPASSPSSPPPPSDPSPSSGLSWEHALGLPLPAFQSMARALRERGAWGRSTLRESGRVAGTALFDALDHPNALSPDAFWRRVGAVTGPLGLGSPEYRVLVPGVGSVTLVNGSEALREDGGACHFSAGWIGGLLTETAREPVAVLEVRCAALGPGDGCQFLVGSPDRLRDVRRQLTDGITLTRALRVSESESRAPEPR